MAEETPRVEFTLEDVAFLGGLVEDRLPLQNMKEASAVSHTLRRLGAYVMQQTLLSKPPEGNA
jgi:hypothetical protein